MVDLTKPITPSALAAHVGVSLNTFKKEVKLIKKLMYKKGDRKIWPSDAKKILNHLGYEAN